MNDEADKLDSEALEPSVEAGAVTDDSSPEPSLLESDSAASSSTGDDAEAAEAGDAVLEDQAANVDVASESGDEDDLGPNVDEEGADDEGAQDEVAAPVKPGGPVQLDLPEEEEISHDWYILKVQSNRERSIAQALRRKIAIEGLDHLFGQVLVPTEKVTEFKGGKKKIVERKLWPGYIAVEMHVNDDTWFAIRETSGIGDFTGSGGKPTPMQPNEIAMILHTEEEEAEEAPKLDIKFNPGDKVKVMEGNFENFEGEVSSIDETHGRVTVMLSIFGRPTPVELEYWQVEGL